MSPLHLESSGSADHPLLVLLHGWGSHSGVWESVTADLEKHFHLHKIDLPGHGYSRCQPAEPSDFASTVEAVAAVILMQVSPHRKIMLCGWSLGGQVALAVASRWPSRVQGLLLVAATPCFVGRADWPQGMDVAVLQQFSADLNLNYAKTLQRFLALQMRGSEAGDALLMLLRKELFARGEPSPAALQAGLRMLMENDLRATCRKITQPVWLLHGETDTIAAPAAAIWMQQNIPRAELSLLPGCGHAPFLSHPQAFIEAALAMRYATPQ